MNKHARTILPAAVHERLRHLAVDRNTSLANLLVEGALLLLRYHGLGDGLPEPQPIPQGQRKVIP